MKPFNPEKAQFYYDTASSFQEALVKSSNQLLEYEDKIRTLKNDNDELKKQVDSLVANLAAAHEDRNEEAKSVFLAKQVEIPELLRENASLRALLVRIRNEKDLLKVRPGAQDQYAGMPPLYRLIDAALSKNP